ncbi:MAG: hypothetical protein EBU84_20385, partial [Actinobacteria bacterium]|nr:hypothetical protein [Actinomycetota bacterium]
RLFGISRVSYIANLFNHFSEIASAKFINLSSGNNSRIGVCKKSSRVLNDNVPDSWTSILQSQNLVDIFLILKNYNFCLSNIKLVLNLFLRACSARYVGRVVNCDRIIGSSPRQHVDAIHR